MNFCEAKLVSLYKVLNSASHLENTEQKDL